MRFRRRRRRLFLVGLALAMFSHATACVTDAGAPLLVAGSVAGTTPDGSATVVVADAFAFVRDASAADTDARASDEHGGLSGAPLAGEIQVRVRDAASGAPVADAVVIIARTTARTDAGGIAFLDGIVGGQATVTVAAPCYSPRTWVDVPVDTVTAYMTPVHDLACSEGDPQTYPVPRAKPGTVEGQLNFPGDGWAAVPVPSRATERRAAYLFEASSDPERAFVLPAATLAVTPANEAGHGYAYSTEATPGSATVYVLAGIEDRSVTPPSFVPHVMGVARGIAVASQTVTPGVDIAMDVHVDHLVTILATPPAAGSRGPDRFTASVATTLGVAGYALFPGGARTVSLPPGTLSFIVPALDHALAAEALFVVGAAETGPSAAPPASVSRSITTVDRITLDAFPAVPILAEPAEGLWNGTHVSFGGDGDLVRVDITGGARTWTILAPGGAAAFDLPDLAALAPMTSLPRGEITTTVYTARMAGFSYATASDAQARSGAWSSYAVDTRTGVY